MFFGGTSASQSVRALVDAGEVSQAEVNYLFFDTCSGLPLRLVEANSSNCFSLIHLLHTLGRTLELANGCLTSLGGKGSPCRLLLCLRLRWHTEPPL